MEAEAAFPHPKKRRTKVYGRQKTEETLRLAVAAVDAPRSEPAAYGQEPPPVAGEEGAGVDHISNLPDAVLGKIISLLPTKDAARTQTLASRWLHLWLSAPLNLDHSSLPADEVQVGIVSRILAAHPGPGRRLSVPVTHLHRRPAMVDAWLHSSSLNNLQELEIEASRFGKLFLTRESLPVSSFRFSATLCVATISQCRVLDRTVDTLHLPQLRQLELYGVYISETSLHSIIAGCPVLECLLLNRNIGIWSIRINSPSLISIGMCHGQLIIEDAPSLERLLQLEEHYGLHISVISAPKLETLGCLSDRTVCSDLEFGTTVIQELRAVGFTTVVYSVKILAISVNHLSLDMVINLMRFFPCLEKLYIKSCVSRDRNFWRRKHRNLIRCLDIQLKTVVLRNYRGIKSQVNFATFFVLYAKMLQFMRFERAGGTDNDNEMFVAEQRRSLQLEKRASREAQFHFTTCHRCHHVEDLTHVKHVRDLSITDPFECRC